MYRQYVFLVHGMGEFAEGTWSGPFVDAIVKALKHYDPYDKDADAIERGFRFIPVSYDRVFNGYRKRWGGLADGAVAKMCAVHDRVGEAFQRFSDSVHTEQGWESFFWTHLFDAFLWYTLPEARKAVLACVNEQISKGLKEWNGDRRAGRAHVIAHSLGTSVIHDSLVGLRFWAGHEGLFHPENHVWRTVGMISNVGRLLQATFELYVGQDEGTFDVHRSVLNPEAPDSICQAYVNAHHKIDPFTWLRRFRPDGGYTDVYKDVEVTRFMTPSQVHDFDHYFADPEVHLPLLREITQNPTMGTGEELTKAVAEFKADYKSVADLEFDNLLNLLGADPDGERSAGEILIFLYKTFKELKK